MRYTMTFLESDFNLLETHLRHSKNEKAAYLFARVVNTPDETRLLVYEVSPVFAYEIDSQSPIGLSIPSRSYVNAIKKSRLDKSAFIFVHSHPTGPMGFSVQDDHEESILFEFANRRNMQPVHASLVASNGATCFRGRVWLSDGTTAPVELIRVIGDRWRFFFCQDENVPIPEYFDRQVKAFGTEFQQLLSRLHIGIVGAGGTGSAVAEQLTRLGVGRLTIIDHDCFDDSNVNRVYGSRVMDKDIPKVTIVARHAEEIGLGTRVIPIQKHLGFKSVAKKLRDCDLVFGCTDDQWGRSVLSRLAIYYIIPIIDLGVIIDPERETIRAVTGRVTILQPGYACLYCRERITAEGVASESISISDPNRADALAAEGYIPGVQMPAPAVVSFTSAIASAAIAEFIDRVIGYKTSESKSSEFIHRFDADAISRNTRPSRVDCFCSDRTLWGAGDRKLFLGITWRQES